MAAKKNPGGVLLDPLLTRPEKVALVALGSSCMMFVQEMISGGTKESPPFDEVWTVNRGVQGFKHDKLFCMDDFRWIEKKKDGYAEFLKKHDEPIITSTVYPEYPSAVPYPLNEVLETCGDDVFAANTVSYAVAYAVHIRVKTLYVYGADFFYPGGRDQTEKGGQAVAYMLGMARHFGMHYVLPQQTTLLYANTVKPDEGGIPHRPYYGYHRIQQMKEEAKKEKERKDGA